MAYIVLKKAKLIGNWQSNTQVDVRFLSSPIGSPLTVPQNGIWVDYPPNTSFEIPGNGNLWLYLNGSFFSMCHQPLNPNPTQINTEDKIPTGIGDVFVKYDVIP